MGFLDYSTTGWCEDYKEYTITVPYYPYNQTWWWNCPHCSKCVEVTDKFCRYCGAQLIKPTLEEKIKIKIEQLEQMVKNPQGEYSKDQIYAFENDIQLLKELLKDV